MNDNASIIHTPKARIELPVFYLLVQADPVTKAMHTSGMFPTQEEAAQGLAKAISAYPAGFWAISEVSSVIMALNFDEAMFEKSVSKC